MYILTAWRPKTICFAPVVAVDETRRAMRTTFRRHPVSSSSSSREENNSATYAEFVYLEARRVRRILHEPHHRLYTGGLVGTR